MDVCLTLVSICMPACVCYGEPHMCLWVRISVNISRSPRMPLVVSIVSFIQTSFRHLDAFLVRAAFLGEEGEEEKSGRWNEIPDV